MSAPPCQVRRATLDDLPQLTRLWETMRFPVEELARRATEFQVAIDGEGKLLGAIGLSIEQKHGRIHSEGFVDFAMADELRPTIWERLHSVATNHGLTRLWTQEDAPFWTHSGMVRADEGTLPKLPAPWRGLSRHWLTLKLKEDLEEVISLDKEFRLFMESERQRTERAMQHARTLKAVATLVAVLLLILVMVGAFFVLRRSPIFLHH